MSLLQRAMKREPLMSLDAFDDTIQYIDKTIQDCRFECLVSLRSSDRPQARTLLHPDVYAHLDRAWDAPVADRAPCLHAFLSNWYAGMRETGWLDSHKGPEGG